MRAILLLVFFAFIFFNAKTQEDKIIRYNTTKDNTEEFIKTALQYPQFIYGKAILKSGGEAQAKLNYNYLTNQILFIDGKGDTLELIHPENFDKIVVEADTFCYANKIYVRQVTHLAAYNLFLKRTLNYLGTEKKSGYGGYSATSATQSQLNFSDGHMMRNLSLDQNSLYQFSDAYFIADRFNKFFPATKKGIYDLFWKYEAQLKTFVQNNAINFDKKEDVEKLLQYARTLDGNTAK